MLIGNTTFINFTYGKILEHKFKGSYESRINVK